ncbi:hypothetical protein EMN47_16105 [Prolixibacteraceae bacterium JC049]|nr:hypothetical protein [Prolixibacteraceae bacterium JC049]
MKRLLILSTIALLALTAGAQKFKRYPFKSGIVQFQYTGKTTGTETLYFDDYGRLEARHTKTTTKVFGVKSTENKITILKGSQMTTIDNEEGTKHTMTNPLLASMAEENIDFEEFGKKMMESLGFQKVGTETVKGKTCEVWKGIGTIYTWKGLALRTDMNMMGSKFTILATDIKTNVNVPAKYFAIPKSISSNKTSATEEDTPDMAQGMEGLGKMFEGLANGSSDKKSKGQDPAAMLSSLMEMANKKENQEAVKEFSDQSAQMMQAVMQFVATGKKKLEDMTFPEFKKLVKPHAPTATDKQLREAFEEMRKGVNDEE